MLYMLKMHAFAVLFILVCSCNLQRISIAFDEQKENNGFRLKAFIVFDTSTNFWLLHLGWNKYLFFENRREDKNFALSSKFVRISDKMG